MIQILEQLGVGVLAILLYSVFKFRKFLKMPNQLKTKVFWESFWVESKFTWIWSILLILLLSTIIKILPESAESIKTLTGLEIGKSLVSFFTVGIGISSLVDTKKAG